MSRSFLQWASYIADVVARGRKALSVEGAVMDYSGLSPEQYRELQSWDADSRMAFEELAAHLEFECGEQRADAEQHAFAATRLTAVPAPHTPHVNRGALPPKGHGTGRSASARQIRGHNLIGSFIRGL